MLAVCWERSQASLRKHSDAHRSFGSFQTVPLLIGRGRPRSSRD